MKILSKIIKAEFEGEVTIELVERIFFENKINPVRWAIIGANNDSVIFNCHSGKIGASSAYPLIPHNKGFLTISYANFE